MRSSWKSVRGRLMGGAAQGKLLSGIYHNNDNDNDHDHDHDHNNNNESSVRSAFYGMTCWYPK